MFCILRSWHFFLPCLRQIVDNVASCSYTSHGHKVSHFCWNFLFSFILAVAGLESVKVVLVSSHLSVLSALSLLPPILTESASKNLKVFFALDHLILELLRRHYNENANEFLFIFWWKQQKQREAHVMARQDLVCELKARRGQGTKINEHKI